MPSFLRDLTDLTNQPWILGGEDHTHTLAMTFISLLWLAILFPRSDRQIDRKAWIHNPVLQIHQHNFLTDSFFLLWTWRATDTLGRNCKYRPSSELSDKDCIMYVCMYVYIPKFFYCEKLSVQWHSVHSLSILSSPPPTSNSKMETILFIKQLTPIPSTPSNHCSTLSLGIS